MRQSGVIGTGAIRKNKRIRAWRDIHEKSGKDHLEGKSGNGDFSVFIAVITGLMTPLVIQYEEQAVDSISLFLKGSSSARDVLSPFLLLTGAYICTCMLPVLAEFFYEKLRMRADRVFHRKRIDKMQTVRYQYTEDRDVMDLYARIEKIWTKSWESWRRTSAALRRP